MVSIIRLLLLYLVQFTLYGRKQLGTAIKYTTKVLLNICNYYFKWATSAEIVTTTFFKWSIPSLFFVYFWSFQANNFCNGLMWKISVKYPVLGFEPTTSWTWVVSGNHHFAYIFYINTLAFQTEIKPLKANLINKLQNRVITIIWNKAFWLDVTNHMMCFNQSECIISVTLLRNLFMRFLVGMNNR